MVVKIADRISNFFCKIGLMDIILCIYGTLHSGGTQGIFPQPCFTLGEERYIYSRKWSGSSVEKRFNELSCNALL